MAHKHNRTEGGSRAIAALPILVAAILVPQIAAICASEIRGPFQSTQRTSQMSSSHFYIHNATGDPFEIRVRCQTMEGVNSNWVAFPRLMVRAFDVDEQRIFRGDITCPELTKLQRLPQEVAIRLPRSKPGVAQVVVSGGRTPQTTFTLATDPPLPLGIMTGIKVITPPEDGIEEGFIYVPPGARQLHLEPVDAQVIVWDENGTELLRDKAATIPVKKTGVVWRIAVKPDRWPGAKILSDGFPIIICPSEKTARAINASMERLDDGTIVAHKFQVRLDRLLRTTFRSPDCFALPPIPSFEPLTDAFLADPERYRYLIVGYTPPLPYLNLWTQRQVLDARRPYFGGIHAPSKYGKIFPPYTIPGSPLNTSEPFVHLPPATDEPRHETWTSFSPWGFPAGMAFVYNLDEKVNPYHHNRHLLNRVIIAACRDLMLLNEGELIPGGSGDWPGHIGFVFRNQMTDAYGYVGRAVKELYPDIHREWTEGLTRFADRIAYMSVFAPANQAAHIPYGLWQVYKGSGDDFYRDMTRYTSQRICDVLQKPAGYLVEGYGPCTSYNGITLDLFAMLYVDTHMPLFKESLQKAFYCFNHTVAPEPSGQLIGVTDLNHRVQMPWTYTQHGGGKRIIAPYLKEAGVWFREKPTEEMQAKLVESIRERAKISPYSLDRCAEILQKNFKLAGGSTKRCYQYYNPQIMTGGFFPFEEEPFFRNLGDEFICVKRPGYYCMVYVGKPGIPRRTRPVPPMEKGARTGGGISLLWTPDYGIAFAGQGWNSYCHHGLIVDMGNDVVRTADYFAVEFDLDTENRTLAVRGKVKDVPLEYRYTYRFADDRIAVQTEVKAAEDVTARSCCLQFPLFASKERGFHCEIPAGPTECISLANNTGTGVQLRFGGPVRPVLGCVSKQKVHRIEYVIQQMKIELPNKWEKGKNVVLSYDIVPTWPK